MHNSSTAQGNVSDATRPIQSTSGTSTPAKPLRAAGYAIFGLLLFALLYCLTEWVVHPGGGLPPYRQFSRQQRVAALKAHGSSNELYAVTRTALLLGQKRGLRLFAQTQASPTLTDAGQEWLADCLSAYASVYGSELDGPILEDYMQFRSARKATIAAHPLIALLAILGLALAAGTAALRSRRTARACGHAPGLLRSASLPSRLAAGGLAAFLVLHLTPHLLFPGSGVADYADFKQCFLAPFTAAAAKDLAASEFPQWRTDQEHQEGFAARTAEGVMSPTPEVRARANTLLYQFYSKTHGVVRRVVNDLAHAAAALALLGFLGLAYQCVSSRPACEEVPSDTASRYPRLVTR